jgi:hypothetical protein
MRALTVALASLPLLAPLAAPLLAQDRGVPLAQVERRYRGMAEVHILKCDRDGNEIFTRTEMFCVSGIYQQMYLDTD